MALKFQSPRFEGEPHLLQILNDPDTGLMKLGPGSPPESVRRLQQALFDLGWTLGLPLEDLQRPRDGRLTLGEVAEHRRF